MATIVAHSLLRGTTEPTVQGRRGSGISAPGGTRTPDPRIRSLRSPDSMRQVRRRIVPLAWGDTCSSFVVVAGRFAGFHGLKRPGDGLRSRGLAREDRWRRPELRAQGRRGLAAFLRGPRGVDGVWTDIWFDNENPHKRHRRWRQLPVRWGQVLRLLDY